MLVLRVMKYMSRTLKGLQKFRSRCSGKQFWAGDMGVGITNVKGVGQWYQPGQEVEEEEGQRERDGF